jgi:hypothetical protein
MLLFFYVLNTLTFCYLNDVCFLLLHIHVVFLYLFLLLFLFCIQSLFIA